jgi:hypothetical protein
VDHESLIARGAVWLQRTKRCEPVLYGLSSGPEIPDAIGWQAANRGSIVLEVKVSRSDFMRDKLKKHDAKMGDHRYILCPAGMVSPIDVERHAPGYGLLWAHDARVRLEEVVPAPLRQGVNHAAEVRHLRQALIHVSYNIADHGYEIHLPTLTKWGGSRGMRKRESGPVLNTAKNQVAPTSGLVSESEPVLGQVD